MSAPSFESLKQSPAGAIVQPQSVGKYKEVLYAMLGPTSYETGGVTLRAEDIGLTWINFVAVSASTSASRICLVIYPDNEGPCKTVKLFFADLAGTQIANATNLSTFKFRLNAQGAY
jgi:hypothetical protein